MSIQEIEQRLADAQEQLERAMQALRARWQADKQAAYWSAHEAVLSLERELAAAKGAEHAVPLDFPVKWDAGCPLPHLFRNDCRALLTFRVREHDPGWDGTTVEVIDPADPKARLLALVEFS